jgi:uncharacterized protein (DUF1499 family)
MARIVFLLGAVLLLALAVLALAQFGLFSGKPPQDLGVRDGKLKPPSRTPNSVSSQADLHADHPMRDYARIAPLPAGPAGAPLGPLQALLAAKPGARIVEQRPDYLRVEFSTRLMRYVDDAEFWFDPAAGAGGAIQVRSASRLGRKDFGVNRARIEALRARLAPPAS